MDADNAPIVIAMTVARRAASAVRVGLLVPDGGGMVRRTSVSTFLITMFWAGTVPAQSREIVRGRLTADSGRSIPNALISTTRAPDRAVRQTRTGADGNWSIVWPDGTGDYLVQATAIGFEPGRARATRHGSDSVLVINMALRRLGAQQLAAVVTQGQRPRPDRAAIQGSDVGASEQSNTAGPGTAMSDRLPADLAGDLSAAAMLVPGAMPASGGISVLGLGPAQNSVTLNGLAFGGGQIPRDAATSIRVSTSMFDPAAGWFSGARTNVQMAAGGLFSARTARLTVDAPALQYNDPTSARLGQRFVGSTVSVGGSGQLIDDRLSYNYGLQGSRRSATAASLLTADANLLRSAGVAEDSVTRFLELAASQRIPIAGDRSNVLTDNIVFLGRIDHAPYDWKALRPATSTAGLTTYASWSRRQAQGMSPTATPSHTGETKTLNASAQALYSTYFGNDYLADLRSGVSVSRSALGRSLRVPDGRVIVASDFSNQSGGVTPLQFGGSSAAGTNTSWSWESSAELQLYPARAQAHRVRVTADWRLDEYRQGMSNNALGTYVFNSLGDLAINHPAVFTRTLEGPARRGGEWNGFLALGDLWRVRPGLQLLLGARVEANAFTATPPDNPAVERVFGVRTSATPKTTALSPRLGFDWNMPGFWQGRGAILRGGVGQFRNMLPPTLLAGAIAQSGSPDGARRIACLGDAVPRPDWAAFEANESSIPQACASGATPAFSDAAPDVQLVAANFEPQRSWRGNLSWSSKLRSVPYTIETIYSSNLHQPGLVDLNFSGVSQFAVDDGNRPVFVSSDDIVAATGAVSGVRNRRSNEFARVLSSVSDLRAVSTQTTISTLAPLIRLPGGGAIGGWRLAYSIASARAQQRGFDGSTAGDPRLMEWARTPNDVRHQLTSSMTVLPSNYLRGIGIVLLARVQSGMPITPVIRTDVNGDGLANDRAFIPNSSTIAPPGFADMLAAAPRGIRDCLTRQAGRIASRSSCSGPWTSSLNASVIMGREPVAFLPRGMEIAFGLVNSLGGLDQALHGARNLRGWGTSPAPDPVLFTASSFDQRTNQFRYTTNPRFGSTSPSATTTRAPFRLTIDVSLDIAPPRTGQQLNRWLRPGRGGREGTRITEVELARRLQRNVPDPYGDLLQQTDYLLLSPVQVQAVQVARAEYRARIDSMWASLARTLVATPDSYDAAKLFRDTDGVIDNAWELTRLHVASTLPGILTPAQLGILPGWASRFYNAPGRFHQRVFVP
jgi:hypothetical protein